MSTKKHYYKIVYNTISARKKEFTYNYGNTKGIKLLISNTGVSVEYYSSSTHTNSDISENRVNLVSDAVKKAMLLYMIHYSKSLKIKKITVRIDDDIDTVDVTQSNTVFCMVDKELIEKLPDEWMNATSLTGILSYTKTSYDSRVASLFAFLSAKSKILETERFFYLWMSFNGIYGYISKLIEQVKNVKPITNEKAQIVNLLKAFQLGGIAIDRKKQAKIAHEVAGLVKKVDAKMSKTFLSTNEGVSLSQSILEAVNKEQSYDLTAYGYLLTQFAYYYRCNLFHADKPISLFSFYNEGELHCLRAISDLLEEFILETLPNLFDDTYINDVLIPKIEAVT